MRPSGLVVTDTTPYFHLFADIPNGLRVFYHYWPARTRRIRAEKQSENRPDDRSPVLPDVRIEGNPGLRRFIADVPKSGDPFKGEVVNKLHVYDNREKFPGEIQLDAADTSSDLSSEPQSDVISFGTVRGDKLPDGFGIVQRSARRASGFDLSGKSLFLLYQLGHLDFRLS